MGRALPDSRPDIHGISLFANCLVLAPLSRIIGEIFPQQDKNFCLITQLGSVGNDMCGRQLTKGVKMFDFKPHKNPHSKT